MYPKGVRVTLDELVDALPASKQLVKEQVSRIQGKALNLPEHRAQVERNKRRAAYETTKAELRKWDSLVNRIQSAQVVDFTGNHPTGSTTVNDMVDRFQPRQELEKEIDRVVRKSLVENEKKLWESVGKSVEEEKVGCVLCFGEPCEC